MKLSLQITAFVCLLFSPCFAQQNTIVVPTFNDKYSNYVKELEAGKTDINYTDFRDSFLESTQYSKKGTEYSDLRKAFSDNMAKQDYLKASESASKMLSIDYTSMYGHMYLDIATRRLNDTVTSNKHRTIARKLIGSIMESGTGKTCDSGLHVVQVEEEYFIANTVLNATVQSQSTINGTKNKCDALTLKTKNGESITIYFEANKVFEQYSKLLSGGKK
jgi:hypothetical protein